MIIRTVVLTVLFSLINISYAEEMTGPFGIAWGMTASEIENQGIELTLKSESNEIKIYTASSLPKNLSIANYYELSFGKKHGLQEVYMFSDYIINDSYGDKGKEKYNSLKKSLVSKYGEPRTDLERIYINIPKLSPWNEPNEFYQCLSHDLCGTWFLVIPLQSGQHITLELNGFESGKGQINLRYTGPKWVDIEKRIDEADEDAL